MLVGGLLARPPLYVSSRVGPELQRGGRSPQTEAGAVPSLPVAVRVSLTRSACVTGGSELVRLGASWPGRLLLSWINDQILAGAQGRRTGPVQFYLSLLQGSVQQRVLS